MGLALLLILGFALLKPTLRVVWPELAVECALREGARVDPWGKAWVPWMKEGFASSCYSCGPNGRDEDGGGDDVWGMAGDFAFAAEPDRVGWNVLGLLLAPLHLLGAGVLLAWGVVSRRLWSAARREIQWELLWAAVMAAGPVAVVWGGVLLVWNQVGWSDVPSTGMLLVPVQVALGSTLSLVVYLAAVWRRLSRDPAGSA